MLPSVIARNKNYRSKKRSEAFSSVMTDRLADLFTRSYSGRLQLLGQAKRLRVFSHRIPTEDEEFADIEAAREAEDITLTVIPTELVPEVRSLLARKHSA
jgi:hypothetical protein